VELKQKIEELIGEEEAAPSDSTEPQIPQEEE
jgi:hypothetical protein